MSHRANPNGSMSRLTYWALQYQQRQSFERLLLQNTHHFTSRQIWTSQISYDGKASLLRMLSDWAALIYPVTIATNYIEPLEAAHAHIDDERYDMGLSGTPGQPNLDLLDQLWRCSVACTNATLSDWAALLYPVTIATNYIVPLEAAHAHIDDERYDMGLSGTTGQPNLDLSDQLRSFIVASTNDIRLRSANVQVLWCICPRNPHWWTQFFWLSNVWVNVSLLCVTNVSYFYCIVVGHLFQDVE